MTEDERPAEHSGSTPENAQTADEPAAEPADPSRRRLMTAVVGACAGLIAVGVGVPAVTMFVGPMIENTPQEWRQVAHVTGRRCSRARR